MNNLSEFEQTLLVPWVHGLCDALRFVGLRDRFRCPTCLAVGTFKPHGGRFDDADLRKRRRWLCKWCGYYIGPEGRMFCVIDTRLGVWREPDAVPDGWTPEQVLAQSVRPWNG